MRKFLSAAIAIGLGACASAPTAGDQPGLAVPPPPAHVVPITPEAVIEPVGEIPAPPSTTAPAGRGGTRGTRESPPKPGAGDARADTKPGETKPDQPVQPDTPPAAAPVAPPPPAPQLRTAESNGAEANVRGTIDRARNLLNTVDYRRLTRARQKAYDDAKAFAQQADDALKAGNVAFAQGVANKAETLAKDLAGR